MKLTLQKVEMPELGLEDEDGRVYFVEVPRSISEEYLFQLRTIPGPDAYSRQANAKIAELIRGWNLTDDEGQPVPLMRQIRLENYKDDDGAVAPDKRPKLKDGEVFDGPLTAREKWQNERMRVLGIIPVETFDKIAEALINKPPLTDAQKEHL